MVLLWKSPRFSRLRKNNNIRVIILCAHGNIKLYPFELWNLLKIYFEFMFKGNQIYHCCTDRYHSCHIDAHANMLFIRTWKTVKEIAFWFVFLSIQFWANLLKLSNIYFDFFQCQLMWIYWYSLESSASQTKPSKQICSLSNSQEFREKNLSKLSYLLFLSLELPMSLQFSFIHDFDWQEWVWIQVRKYYTFRKQNM